MSDLAHICSPLYYRYKCCAVSLGFDGKRERQHDGDYSFHHHHQEVDRVSNRGMTSNLLISSSQDLPSTPPLPPSRLPDGVGEGVGGVSYIEHRVTKIDTLAGVAIKYGVEVNC